MAERKQSETPTEKPNPPRPEIENIIGFIMQAENLAEGKNQQKVVSELAQEFAELMYYVETLETQRDNLKKAHSSLLQSKSKVKTVSAAGNPNGKDLDEESKASSDFSLFSKYDGGPRSPYKDPCDYTDYVYNPHSHINRRDY